MVFSACISTAKPLILASLSSDSPLPSESNLKHSVHKANTAPLGKTINGNQPSIAEIERAIGAGIFRDRDPSVRKAKTAPLGKTIKGIQPSVVEIERAIGAGNFRDRDPSVRKAKSSSLGKTINGIQPSVVEIERAIGAGNFRDKNSSDPAQSNTFWDSIFSNSIGMTEGSLERRLRETGEWISDQTETATRSSGKAILKVMFFWLIPAWLLSLFVACGAIKLPFNVPLLDDLIM
ncbi:hypothetical protein Nepgr_017005 [Nepenthes gracilis]|uniref:Chlororespiratory reduction 3 n=1 Tax=Nepenthes gracilis TaxID=150966 RepID=A0AAD3XSP1_NEPGR|nr:hypothetical protein Nepgr_017005 [Nepenthes gracilis]